MTDFSTDALHGSSMKDAYGALVTPIYNSSTFIFDSTAQGAALPSFVSTQA